VSENDDIDAKVLEVMRRPGNDTFYDIHARMPWRETRTTDRALQRLRKAGKIRFHHSKWSVVSTPFFVSEEK